MRLRRGRRRSCAAAFKGIGGGVLLPVGMAIIFRLFDPTERARATALLMIPILLGPAFGPTLGGYLATAASWNAIFLINLPIGVLAFLLALLVLRGKTEEQAANGKDKPPDTQHCDWVGLALAMAVGLAFSGGLYNRVGPRILAVIGAMLVTVSMVGFTRLSIMTTGADLQLWLILRGLGLFIQPLQTLSVSVVSRQQMARATSLRNSTTTVANAVGVAVLTSYLTQQATTHLKDAAATTCAAQTGQHLSLSALHACVGQQAEALGMNDTFFVCLIACAACAAVAFFVGRDPALEAAKEARKRGGQGKENVPQMATL
jgi:MFS family permease